MNALSKLRLLVIQRGADPIDLTAQLLAYVELLLEYPVDVVLDVLQRWPRKSKFWPTWFELEEAIGAEIDESEATTHRDDDRPEISCELFENKAIYLYERRIRECPAIARLSPSEHSELKVQGSKVWCGESLDFGLQRFEVWSAEDLKTKVSRLGPPVACESRLWPATV